MNRIMELSRAVCQAYHGWHQEGNSDFTGSEYADLERARAALQAEVTRMEAELKGANHQVIDYHNAYRKANAEAIELMFKLAALGEKP